jgi:hypothetical protein
LALSQLFGLALAALHAGLVSYLVWCIFFAGEPDWPMYWTILLVVDFPLSLVAFPVSWSIQALGIQASRPNARLLDLQNFLIPLFVLGLGGTLWWFFMPQGIAWIFGRIAG